MTTAFNEYAQLIMDQFISGRWKFERKFQEIDIYALNSAIAEAEFRLRHEEKFLDEKNEETFHRLVSFIKATIPYTADEIFMDMYNSQMRYWIPHPVFLKMTTPQLNTFLLDKLIELQDKKLFDDCFRDCARFNNLSLFIKSFVE